MAVVEIFWFEAEVAEGRVVYASEVGQVGEEQPCHAEAAWQRPEVRVGVDRLQTVAGEVDQGAAEDNTAVQHDVEPLQAVAAAVVVVEDEGQEDEDQCCTFGDSAYKSRLHEDSWAAVPCWLHDERRFEIPAANLDQVEEYVCATDGYCGPVEVEHRLEPAAKQKAHGVASEETVRVVGRETVAASSPPLGQNQSLVEVLRRLLRRRRHRRRRRCSRPGLCVRLVHHAGRGSV